MTRTVTRLERKTREMIAADPGHADVATRIVRTVIEQVRAGELTGEDLRRWRRGVKVQELPEFVHWLEERPL